MSQEEANDVAEVLLEDNDQTPSPIPGARPAPRPSAIPPPVPGARPAPRPGVYLPQYFRC